MDQQEPQQQQRQPDGVVAPECLTDSEREYHTLVHTQAVAAQAAWESWARHLGIKYRLAAGDMIAPDGAITRAPRSDTA